MHCACGSRASPCSPMNELAQAAHRASSDYTSLDRVLRRNVLGQLRGLLNARVVIADAFGATECGTSSTAQAVRVTVTDPAFYQAVAAGGSVGAGEAYMAGHWHCDDLVALIRLLVRNRDVLDGMETGL